MIKPVKFPRCVANLFSLGNSTTIGITQDLEHRPDKIPIMLNHASMKEELIDNYISNKSPITLKKGDSYVITDSLFKGYFAQ